KNEQLNLICIVDSSARNWVLASK
ncbi:hypothetical protein RB2150_01169, partial [Rhodobacteraceae bacterium HTCC2150]